MIELSVSMARAGVKLTPAEERALARFIASLFRVVVRMGWGWGTVAVLGVMAAGWAVWTLPTWWGLVRDWLDE